MKQDNYLLLKPGSSSQRTTSRQGLSQGSGFQFCLDEGNHPLPVLFSHQVAQDGQLFGEDIIIPGFPLAGGGTGQNQRIPVIDGNALSHSPVDKLQVKIKGEGNPGHVAIGLGGQEVVKPVNRKWVIGRYSQSIGHFHPLFQYDISPGFNCQRYIDFIHSAGISQSEAA